jgi:hypothetical protein
LRAHWGRAGEQNQETNRVLNDSPCSHTSSSLVINCFEVTPFSDRAHDGRALFSRV